MRITVLLAVAVAVAACNTETPPPAADTSMSVGAATPASVAAVGGMWNVNVMPLDRDTVLTSYVLDATDSTAWKLQFAGRTDWVPLRQTGMSGDTLLAEAGPFESGIRRGQQVSTVTKSWLEDGRLVSTVVARYASAPDSAINLRSVGTRQ